MACKSASFLKSSLHPELSQKSDFQPLTTKPDNIDYSTVKTVQIGTLGWFPRLFYILWELKIFKFQLNIHK
jgi:hypothetical protein